MNDKIVVIDLQLTESIEAMFKEYIDKKPRIRLEQENVVFGVNKKPNITMNRKMVMDEVCKAIIESGVNGLSVDDAVEKTQSCDYSSTSSMLSRISRSFKEGYKEWKLKKTKNRLYATRIV